MFLKTWDYIQTNKLKEFKTLKALLYKVARNTVIDYYRKQNQRQEISLDQGEETIDVIDEKADPVGEMELSSDFKSLEEKLNELKDEYREIILLKYVDELSIAEIASVLNKSQGNVRVQIFRAVNALKKITAPAAKKDEGKKHNQATE